MCIDGGCWRFCHHQTGETMSRIALALLPLLSIVACNEPKCGESGSESECAGDAIADVRVESDRLVVELNEGERRYQLTCMTEVVALSRQDPSGGVTPLVTDHEAVADRFEGYWLDGEFVYPYFDEGCDVVVCVELDEDPEIGLLEYAVTGSDAPPEDLQSYLDQHGPGGSRVGIRGREQHYRGRYRSSADLPYGLGLQRSGGTPQPWCGCNPIEPSHPSGGPSHPSGTCIRQAPAMQLRSAHT